jgi:hypothetical protein
MLPSQGDVPEMYLCNLKPFTMITLATVTLYPYPLVFQLSLYQLFDSECMANFAIPRQYLVTMMTPATLVPLFPALLRVPESKTYLSIACVAVVCKDINMAILLC